MHIYINNQTIAVIRLPFDIVKKLYCVFDIVWVKKKRKKKSTNQRTHTHPHIQQMQANIFLGCCLACLGFMRFVRVRKYGYQRQESFWVWAKLIGDDGKASFIDRVHSRNYPWKRENINMKIYGICIKTKIDVLVYYRSTSRIDINLVQLKLWYENQLFMYSNMTIWG